MKKEKDQDMPIIPPVWPNTLYPVNGIDPLLFDPLGSYTGLTDDPVQDADDL